MPTLKVLRLKEGATLPTQADSGAVGYDLYACEFVSIGAGEQKLVDTGIAAYVDDDHEIQIRPRSSMAGKRLAITNSPGTVDPSYRGPLKVILANQSKFPYHISKGDRIAQLVVAPRVRVDVVEVDSLDDTERGTGGFGSTGV